MVDESLGKCRFEWSYGGIGWAYYAKPPFDTSGNGGYGESRLWRVFGASEEVALSGFTDISPSAWYYGEMAKAVGMGAFSGSDGKLNPEKAITRQEAFTVLANAFCLEGGESGSDLSQFSDAEMAAPWARGSMAALVSEGYVKGAGGKLNPDQEVTRAEFAQIIHNMAGSYAQEEGDFRQDIDGNLIVRAGGVTPKNLTVKGDLVLADGVSNGTVTLENVTVEGRILLRVGAEVKLTGLSKVKTVQVNQRSGKSTILVEENSEIQQVICNSEALITGDGKVGSVAANVNNIQVNTPQTKVIAASGTTGVKAGDTAVAPGASITNTNSSGSSAGGSSGGSSSSGSGIFWRK